MSTKAGHVRVPMTQSQVLSTLLWLSEPSRIDPAIAHAFATLRLRTHAVLLPVLPRLLKDDPIGRRTAIRELRKALRLPRSHVQLSRGSAAYLGSLRAAAFLEWRHAILVDIPAGRWPSSAVVTFAIVEACARALQPRGRPRRTRLDLESAIARERRRLEGRDAVRCGDESNLRKLLKLEKWYRWTDELAARGETIATTELPPP